ncbi:MAG TPA: hypothetical protein DIW54_11835 [Chitinophagaceae bacterium]|nr:hypothetical protein [Chitinophagaceae bacterium]
MSPMHHNTEDGQDQQSADQDNSTGRSIDADDKTPSTEASLPAEQLQTNNPKPVTDNMEVHHHTHHPKKWKEYFWEFFMLFLAVFCGFLAEIQVEHYIENKREQQYIQALLKDLQSDTASLKRAIKGNYTRENLLDSILTLSNSDLKKSENAQNFVRLFMLSTFTSTHRPSTIAFEQLKYTGSFRLIRGDQGVVDSILQYDKANERLVAHNEFYGDDLNNYWEYFYPICDVKIFRDSTYAIYNARERRMTGKTVPPLHLSQERLTLFTGHATRQVLINAVNRSMMESKLKRAEVLIDFLQKRYHLSK